MAAPTILSHGTEEQIERHVTPIYDGSVAWCQLFSEPGSGSDLAGLSTRATRDGDHWVISGQKVWSSGAMDADYGMLLARTDVDVPKHAGISWFAFRVDQPGVTIRPLVEITGHALFNEVFFDDAVVADADLIGGLNNGWAVTQHHAHVRARRDRRRRDHERLPAARPQGRVPGAPGWRRRAAPSAGPSTGRVLTIEELFELARRYGRDRDPLIRQKLARLVECSRTGEWTAKRSVTEAARGRGAGLANVGKLAQTRIAKLSAEIGCEIIGPEATLWDPDGPRGGRYAEAVVFAAASSIYGGTDQIQRNVIGERALGLPKEPDPYKGLSFREVQERVHSDGNR